jgi:diaminopimelate epimerase
MRYYNADGGEAEMCGNGGRCIARFAYLNGIAPARIEFVSMAGRHRAEIIGENVKLGLTDPTGLALGIDLPLSVGRRTVHLLNTGVPHAVEFVDDVARVDVVRLGREIRRHERFAPAGANANFVEPVDRHTFRIRTYERGVEDETLACGTGCVAAAAVAVAEDRLGSPVRLQARGGTLSVHIGMEAGVPVAAELEGPAEITFRGSTSWGR